MPARVPSPLVSFLSLQHRSSSSSFLSFYLLSVILALFVLSFPFGEWDSYASPVPSSSHSSSSHFSMVFPFLLSLALNPLDHLPPCRWKVCWFARWPVVSTPLHMVTYHQSTPTTRFAPRAPWIFMGRK